MNGSDALWAALSQGMPTSYTGMVLAAGGPGRGGGVRAVASALGVDPRTVQRRLVGESRAAGRPTKAAQERGQSARGQALGSKAMRAAHAAAQRGKSVSASAKGAFGWGRGRGGGGGGAGGGGGGGGGYDYESEGDVRTLEDFDDDYADRMWDAFEDGNEQGAWDAFEDGLFDAYGMGDDVYSGIEFVGGEVDTFDIDFS